MNERTHSLVDEEVTYKKGGNNMKTKMKKLIKNQKGMTLIELLAVIVIIAVIALIAIPAIGNIINNSKDKAILADASNIISGAKIAVQDGSCTENDDKSVTCSNTELGDYVENVKGTSYSASKGDDGKWTVTYSEFTNIKNSKFKPTGLDEKNTVTEANLNVVLGKNNSK